MTQTNVKRIYWEERTSDHAPIHVKRMIFELTDGRKMELMEFAEEPAEAVGRNILVVTGVEFGQTDVV